jgi:hypothetical protein
MAKAINVCPCCKKYPECIDCVTAGCCVSCVNANCRMTGPARKTTSEAIDAWNAIECKTTDEVQTNEASVIMSAEEARKKLLDSIKTHIAEEIEESITNAGPNVECQVSTHVYDEIRECLESLGYSIEIGEVEGDYTSFVASWT